MQPSPAPKMLEPSASALGRSATWPPTSAKPNTATLMGNGKRVHISQPTTPTMAPLKHSKPKDLFEYELSEHPEEHFLSPVNMYEFEDWADDSDDDDHAGEIAWDAGITDFALFDSDRRQAQQGQALPSRWNSLLQSQASALQRAVERNRATADPSRRTWTPLADDLPQLTPDSSPNMRDEFDIHAHCKQNSSRRQAIPSYLLETTPSDEETDEDDSEDDSDDDDLPVAYLVERARERRRQTRQLERPGLRFSRTMSGKHHVWRRPSSQMYTLSESPEAERKAEMLYVIQSGGTEAVHHDQHADRGRRR